MAKIVLDPGHVQGYNKGAVSGYAEGTAMYHYAQRLAGKLRDAGVQVELTRKKAGENPSLMDRGRMAKGADLFVSLHSNAASAESAHGVTVFYSIKREGDKEPAASLSKALAELIRGGTRDRGACTRKGGGDWDYYTVIQYAVKAGCPHVFLIEHGFHSHREECEWLLKEENLEAMAQRECGLFLAILGEEAKDQQEAAAGKTMVVNTPGDTLNVRADGVYTAKKLGELAHESTVEVISEAANGWKNIRQGTLVGWVNGAYLKEVEKKERVRITAGSLNIRKGPGTGHAIAGVVHAGEEYAITEEAKNGETRWGALEDGRGWISLKYTRRM